MKLHSPCIPDPAIVVNRFVQTLEDLIWTLKAILLKERFRLVLVGIWEFRAHKTM